MPPKFSYAQVNKGNVLRIGAPPSYMCRGNLVQNGGFEAGLLYWTASNVRIVGGKEPHEGRYAAGLGARRHNQRASWLQQDIPIPTGNPRQFYEIIFHVAGYKDAPAALTLTASWLTDEKQPHGIAAQARIQRRAIGNGSRGKWTTYNIVTLEAPSDAAYLRLHFTKMRGLKAYNFVILDDVVVIRVPAVCDQY